MKVLQMPDETAKLAEQFQEAKPMTTVKKKQPVRPNAPELDEDELFEKTIVDAMTQAAKDAVAENDRLGIPSVGYTNGKRVVRQPPKKPQP
jgi:hypothetical protein